MYTELTPDDKNLSSEDLRRMSMVEVSPGVWAQRVVVVEQGSGSGSGEGFEYGFDSGMN